MGLVEQVVDPPASGRPRGRRPPRSRRPRPWRCGHRAVVRALADGSSPADVEEVARSWRERAFGSDDFAEGLEAFRGGARASAGACGPR